MGYAFACGPGGCTFKWMPDTDYPVRPPEVEELRRRRVHEAWLSQREMAERLHMDVVSFGRAENGRASFTLAQLAGYRSALDATGNRAAQAGAGETP